MMNWRRLFEIKPIEMGTVEMLLIRGVLAWVLWSEFFFGIAQAAQTMPVGLAHFLDLSFLQVTETFLLLKGIFGVALLLWVVGVLPALATGYMLFLIAAVGSLRNSYGNIHHGTQVMGMVVLGCFCAHVWCLLRSEPAHRRLRRFLLADHNAQQTALWWATQAVAATYVVAGVSKLQISGLDWLTGLGNLPLHVEKIGYQHYLGDGGVYRYEHAKEMAAMLASWPMATYVVVGSGLFFELFSFFALFSRWHAAVFGVILWVMHVQISYLMQLEFPMNNWALLLLLINVPWLLLWVLRLCGLKGLA
jgi:hypothetical protein